MTEEQKSSEVEEQDSAAEEALKATADEGTSSAEKSEPTVPLHEHTTLRKRAQAAEIAAATAQGLLDGLKQAEAKATPAVKSPLDLEIARQAADGIAKEDMTISPAIIQADKLHDKQVANEEAQARTAAQLAITQNKSRVKAISTHDDWDAVIAAGQDFLTPAELAYIRAAGDDFGEYIYSQCKVSADRNAPETASKTETAPEKKSDESEAEKKAKEDAEKVPTQKEILKNLHIDPMVEAAAQL